MGSAAGRRPLASSIDVKRIFKAMTATILLGTAGLILLAFFGFGRGVQARELPGHGNIDIPKQLEPVQPEESHGSALFPFARYSNSFFHMGSHAVVMEKLAVHFWTTPAPNREGEASMAVQYHMPHKTLTWRREGEFEIGEGIEEVNTHSFPAWIVVRQVPTHRMTLAYMVWKKNASLQKAMRVVEDAIRSYRPGTAPAAVKEPRMSRVERALAVRGVTVQLDGEPAQKDGVLYHLHTSERWGRVLGIYGVLGPLPDAPHYRWVSPAPPQGNWLGVVWMTPNGVRGMDGEGTPPAAVTARLRMGEAYAVQNLLIDDASMPEPDLDYTLRMIRTMLQTHRAGKLLKRLDP
jgi:hypothetical protein